MRIFSVIIALLVLVLLAAPGIDGVLFKGQYTDLIAAATKANPQMTIKVDSYHLGWLSSEVKTSIQIPLNEPSQPVKNLTLVVMQHVTHGPIVYDEIQQRWDVAWAFIKSNLAFQGADTGPLNQVKIQWDTFASFANDYVSKISIPAFSFTFPEGKAINFQEGRGESLTNLEHGKLKYGKGKFDFGGFSIQDSENKFSMLNKGILLQYEITLQQNGLANGFYQLSLPSASISQSDEGTTTLTDLGFQSSFGTMAPNSYNVSFQFSVGQLVDPKYSINQSNTKISLENLNAKELVNFVNAMTLLQKEPMSPERNDKMAALLPSLFLPNTVVNESTVINTSFGRIVSDGQVSWPLGVNTRQDLVSHIKATKNIRVSVSLVNKIIDLMYPNDSATAAPPAEPSEATLDKEVDDWVTAKKIQLDVGVKLKDLVGAHLSADDFATNIDQFVVRKDMTQDLADQIKKDYADVSAAPKKSETPQVSAPTTKADALKTKIDELLKQGFITKDQDDYTTVLIYENGKLTANGVQVDLGNGS